MLFSSTYFVLQWCWVNIWWTDEWDWVGTIIRVTSIAKKTQNGWSLTLLSSVLPLSCFSYPPIPQVPIALIPVLWLPPNTIFKASPRFALSQSVPEFLKYSLPFFPRLLPSLQSKCHFHTGERSSIHCQSSVCVCGFRGRGSHRLRNGSIWERKLGCAKHVWTFSLVVVP
jgi:hypothetical protein